MIEHEVTPTGPRELTIETHDYEAHESTMVLPFEDTHACLLQSLKESAQSCRGVLGIARSVTPSISGE